MYVCVEVLWPSQPNGIMSSVVSLPNHFSWAGSVLLAVNQYHAHSFPRNWQLPFLNQWKGENDCRKYAHYSLLKLDHISVHRNNPRVPFGLCFAILHFICFVLEVGTSNPACSKAIKHSSSTSLGVPICSWMVNVKHVNNIKLHSSLKHSNPHSCIPNPCPHSGQHASIV